MQVAALGGEKTGARNSGARGVPVAEPARAGRQFGLPRLAEVVKDILASSSSRRWAGDSRGTPTVHDAASCFTGLVLGVPVLQLRALTAGCFVETRCPEPAEIA